MKNILLSAVMLLVSASLSAQAVDGESRKLIDAFVRSNVDTQAEPVDPTVISKVFAGNFFKVLVGFTEPGTGVSSCGSYNYLSIVDTKVTMVEPVHMDIECPDLLSLVKNDFLLSDEDAAALFEASLNVLYPVDDDEMKDVKHIKKDAQWIFLRGRFFDSYTAFIVTTEPDGKIVKIEIMLGYSVE